MYYESEEPANPYYTAVFGSQPIYDTGSAILFRDVNLVAINSTHILGDCFGVDPPVRLLALQRHRGEPRVQHPGRRIAFGWDADTMNAIGVQQFPDIGVDNYGDGGSTHGSWDNNDRVHSSREVSGVYSQFVGAHTDQGRWCGIVSTRSTGSHSGRSTSTSPSGSRKVPTAPVTPSRRSFTEPRTPVTPRSQRRTRTTSFTVVVSSRTTGALTTSLVLNLGVRFEHETGIGESSDQIITGWDVNNPFPNDPIGELDRWRSLRGRRRPENTHR